MLNCVYPVVTSVKLRRPYLRELGERLTTTKHHLKKNLRKIPPIGRMSGESPGLLQLALNDNKAVLKSGEGIRESKTLTW